MKAVPEDFFGQQQRYEIFINKMSQLYKNEKRWGTRKDQAYNRMKMAPFMKATPLKAILSEYNKLSSRGFDCSILAKSLGHLKRAVSGRGHRPKGSYLDYLNLSQMDQSWRMDKVAQDLMFAFEKPQHANFGGENMARVSRSLGELGYKNTDLITAWFNRLDQLVRKQMPEDDLSKSAQFHKAVYGGAGFENFESRHYVYKGFESS